MNFLRSLFLENYWFVSQIFRMGAIFLYITTIILFARFLLEVVIAVEKIIKICCENSKKPKEKGDENDTRFV